MKCVKISRSDVGGLCVEKLSDAGPTIMAELEETVPGDRVMLTIVEMSPEEFEALPEFQGW